MDIEDTTASEPQVTRFLKLTGYKMNDLTGSNKNGRFTTDNGGKYLMDRAGKKVKTLLGPAYPNSKEEEDGG